MFTEKLVSELVGSNPELTNHFGVEVELEHKETPIPLKGALREMWSTVEDGSLKVNGKEYVLKRPMPVEDACKAVTKLGAYIDGYTEIINEGRAGVHVHVNVGDLSVRELVNLIALLHLVEPILVNWCGEMRKGNLFCLRLKDTSYVADLLAMALERENLRHLGTDAIRYAAINLKAIVTHGSLEVRCMRADGNWDDVITALHLLDHLKGLARQIDNPTAIVAGSSENGCEGFVRSIIPADMTDKLGLYVGWEEDCYEAIQNIQYYAYCREW